LADGAFQKFSLAYTRRVLQQLDRQFDGQRIPCIVFTKGGGLWLEEIAGLHPDVVGLDWTVNLGAARAKIGGKVALQGNLDPNVLFAPEPVIREQVAAVLDSFGRPDPASKSTHIFNLGHGINQFTPPEAVSVLVDAVHSHVFRG
jgi:uroporphyrinogen decarboxylase